jgi:hypothetical protein
MGFEKFDCVERCSARQGARGGGVASVRAATRATVAFAGMGARVKWQCACLAVSRPKHAAKNNLGPAWEVVAKRG